MNNSSSNNSKISQETFDETVLENEEIFELNPQEAITETISQFRQQGIKNLESYLVISHPTSENGQEERSERKKFTSLLESLDSFVMKDGKVSLESSSNDIVTILNQVYDYCNQKDAVPFLTLLYSTNSIYTLMSLLAIIPLPATTSTATSSTTGSACTNANDKLEIISMPTQVQQSSFIVLLKILTTILTTKNQSEKEIKMKLKDSFLAMERLVSLIAYFTILLDLDNNHNHLKSQSLPSKEDIQSTYAILCQLVSLATAACKNSEQNKVAFVRVLRNQYSTLTTFIPNYYENLKGKSTIGLISFTLFMIFKYYDSRNNNIEKSHDAADNDNKRKEKAMLLSLMKAYCELITVLCRFDDFRSSPPDAATAAQTDSSYGGVSSAHDHVLEFHRHGVAQTLYNITLLSLHLDHNNNTEGDDDYDDSFGLAAAVLSATRVMAINDEIVQGLVAVGVLKCVKLALDMGLSHNDDDDDENKKGDGLEKMLDKSSINTDSTGSDDNDNHDMCNNNNENSTTTVQSKDTKNNNSTESKIKSQKKQLTAAVIGLIRNLCGNDEIKTTLCLGSAPATNNESTSGSLPSALPSILKAMHEYKNNATIQEHGCGSLAAMALRKPSNAARIVHDNGASAILTAMKLFPNNVLVQRQGALAIRNIVSRLVANTSSFESERITTTGEENGGDGTSTAVNLSSDGKGDVKSNDNTTSVKDIFLDLGAEVILRGITGRHQASVDEAYAALRDLGCPISMVKYDAETQSTTTRTVMFGDFKPQFNPVYGQSGK